MRVVGKLLRLEIEVHAVVDYWHNCEGVYEEDDCFEGAVKDGSDAVFGFDCKHRLEELALDDFDWELEGEQQESWREVGCEFEKGQV